MTAFVLGHEAFGVYFPQASGLLKSSSAGLQSLMPWGLVFLVQDPKLGNLMWDSDPSVLGRLSATVIILFWFTYLRR